MLGTAAINGVPKAMLSFSDVKHAMKSGIGRGSPMGRLMARAQIALVFTIGVKALLAQAAADSLTRYRSLGLPESAGSVPVMYSQAAEPRAFRYREALAAAVNWYRERLKVTMPLTLAVADRDTWEKVQPAGPGSVSYFMPYSTWRRSAGGDIIEGLVSLPARIEDFPGFEAMKADPDLLAEAISFHEAGHISAHALGIGSQNSFCQ